MQNIQLGDFTFRTDDLPEEVKFGGEQMLAVIRYPGGFKEVQSFGPQEQNPGWSGTFNYQGALANARKLEAMYRGGRVYHLRIGSVISRYAVIRKFLWTYRSAIEIPYEIELELAPSESLLYKDPLSARQSQNPRADTSQDNAPTTYTVVYGDTLWGLALRFYGDGSQYRKIAWMNNIADPDLIRPGSKLVIPQ